MTERKEEKKSEQLNMKVTPSFKSEVMDFLKALGYTSDENAMIKFDQERLADILKLAKKNFIYDRNGEYAEIAKTIEQYESLINSKLLVLLKDLSNTEARVRSEYEEQLTSKDQLIEDLQSQKKKEEVAKNDAIKDASDSESAKSLAEKNLADAEVMLQKAEETIQDKERYIQTLLEKLSNAEEKLDGYDSLRQSFDDLSRDFSEYRNSSENAAKDAARASEASKAEAVNTVTAELSAIIDDLKEQLHTSRIEAELAKKDADTARAAALAEIHEAHQKELRGLRREIDEKNARIIEITAKLGQANVQIEKDAAEIVHLMADTKEK